MCIKLALSRAIKVRTVMASSNKAAAVAIAVAEQLLLLLSLLLPRMMRFLLS
jgi:hypothetical protein